MIIDTLKLKNNILKLPLCFNFLFSYLTNLTLSIPGIILYLNNYCDSRCISCNIWKSDKKYTLSFSKTKEILSSLLRYRINTVVLSGGEPLLNPDLIKICSFLKHNNKRIVLVTNGIRLKDFTKELVSLVDFIIISFDAESNKTYYDIRGVDCFHKVIEGIDLISKTRRTHKAILPRIILRCTVQKRNFLLLDKIVDIAQETGADRISFLPIDIFSNAFGGIAKDTLVHSDLILTKEELPMLKNSIEKLIGRINHIPKSHFLLENPKKLMKLYYYFLNIAHPGTNRRFSCYAPWYSIVIEASGEVLPCFFYSPIGNIYQKPLNEILNSEVFSEFRHRVKKGKINECKGCISEFVYLL